MAKRIVISEFMDEAAVQSLRADFDVFYDPALGLQRAWAAERIAHVLR